MNTLAAAPSVTTILAIWGAFIGTVTAGWTIFREWSSGRTKIRMTFQHAGTPLPFVSWGGSEPDRRLYYELTLIVRNAGSHDEHLRSIGAELAEYDQADGEAEIGVGAEIEVELQPRADYRWIVPLDRLPDGALDAGIVGTVRLASGETIRSRVERTDQRVMEICEP